MSESQVESIVVYYNDSEELPRAEYFNNRVDCREFIKVTTSLGGHDFEVRNFRTDERIDVDNEPLKLRFKVTFENGFQGDWSQLFFNTFNQCLEFIDNAMGQQCRHFTIYEKFANEYLEVRRQQ